MPPSGLPVPTASDSCTEAAGTTARSALIPVLFLALFVTAVAGACSYPTDISPREGSCAPFHVTGVWPQPDASNVPVDVGPTFTFSDFPDPNTIGVSTLTLSTGPFRYTGRYVVDLLDRSVRLQPNGYLADNRGFTLSLRPGVRSLTDCALPPPPADANGRAGDAFFFYFRTGATLTTTTAPGAVPPPPSFWAAREIMRQRCAGATCHLATDSDSSCLPSPAGDLSLCPTEAHASLVGVASTQVVRLIRAAPHDSARSYLIRKLLGAPPFAGHSSPPGAPLSYEELRALSAWIDSGAPE